MRDLLIHLLALELRQTRGNISPLLLSVDQAGDGADDFVEASAHLLCRVAVAQRECVVLDGLEVNGDTEGSTELVVALDGVSNGLCEIVNARDGDLRSSACRWKHRSRRRVWTHRLLAACR